MSMKALVNISKTCPWDVLNLYIKNYVEVANDQWHYTFFCISSILSFMSCFEIENNAGIYLKCVFTQY